MGIDYDTIRKIFLVLAPEDRVDANDLRVALCLLSLIDEKSFTAVEQDKLGEKLKIARPHISRCFRHLKDIGLITEGPREGHHHTYQFSPEYWKDVQEVREGKRVKLVLSKQEKPEPRPITPESPHIRDRTGRSRTPTDD